MGKRSHFERRKADFYPTPYEAVIPLLPFVRGGFIEPCAGDGSLIRHLERHGLECSYACDIEPKAEGIEKKDVLFFGMVLPDSPQIITNPPWERDALHTMIDKFRRHTTTWLLFDADWMFTKQAKPYLPYCSRIVPVGRVSWMVNGTDGMDNCCWYEFNEWKTTTKFCHETAQTLPIRSR